MPVLTVKEAATGVGLTQWAIYRVIQRGELTAYKPCGRLRIHEADLEAWLESTRVTVEARTATRPLAVLRQARLPVQLEGDRPTVACGTEYGRGDPPGRALERPQ